MAKKTPEELLEDRELERLEARNAEKKAAREALKTRPDAELSPIERKMRDWADNRERGDATRREIPIEAPMSLRDEIKRILSMEATQQAREFDPDAPDFDEEDDFVMAEVENLTPLSGHEVQFRALAEEPVAGEESLDGDIEKIVQQRVERIIGERNAAAAAAASDESKQDS